MLFRLSAFHNRETNSLDTAVDQVVSPVGWAIASLVHLDKWSALPLSLQTICDETIPAEKAEQSVSYFVAIRYGVRLVSLEDEFVLPREAYVSDFAP